MYRAVSRPPHAHRESSPAIAVAVLAAVLVLGLGVIAVTLWFVGA
jgi:hypothetical protein